MPDVCQLLQNRDLQKIVQFVRRYGYFDVSLDEIRNIIEKHIVYNTLSWVEVGGEIIAVARYNINGDTVDILDIIIRRDYRNKHLLKYMLARDWEKFPNVTKIKYERSFKNNSSERTFSMKKFLGVRK